MRRIGRLAGVLTLGLCAIGVVTFAQGPPLPPRPPQGPPPPPPPPAAATPGLPFPTLSKAELARFQVGKTAFLQTQDVPGGLGPVFNESSCATCHGGT